MDVTINLDDPAAGRVIGRRGGSSENSFAVAMKLQRLHNRLAKSANLPRIPKGVWRFETHEAADEWMMKVWTRTLDQPAVADEGKNAP